MKLFILQLIFSCIAVVKGQVVDKPAGDFLRVKFLAGSVVDQIRVITRPDPGYIASQHKPTVWIDDDCMPVDADVWVEPPPDDSTTCCNKPSLDGLKIWREREDFEVTANESVYVDYWRTDADCDMCEEVYADRKNWREIGQFAAGERYNSYMIQGRVSDGRFWFNGLVEFHMQEIKAIISTSGGYRVNATTWDETDLDGNPLTNHLDDSDAIFGRGFTSGAYDDVRGRIWRGFELSTPTDNNWYKIDCDRRPVCPCPTPAPQTSPTATSNGDPHFKTWKQEHFEYHGQCDMILVKDESFAAGIGLEVQIRTKLVRFWSYIRRIAIRIGNDILEVEGSSEEFSGTSNELLYWINFDYQGDFKTLGGFPVKSWRKSHNKQRFIIDLSSKFPGQTIEINTFQEFVRIDFLNSTEESFGKAIGLLGDFKTGKTLARDGITVLDDFFEYGSEWQVLPSEDMLFHGLSYPQFPEKCMQPEDPRGDRRRRLDESSVSEADAERACATIKDPFERKDCVYDVLATQDLGMVGAY